MKKLLTPVINYAIDKAKRNKFVQNLFESPFELSKFPTMGRFTDAYGNTFELHQGLRTKIRPGWERMLTPRKADLSRDYLLKQKHNGAIAASKIVPILKSMGTSFENSMILEIGCHAGGTSFAMAAGGASQVVGTEFAGYKVESVEMNSQRNSTKLVEVTDDLKKIRTGLASLCERSENVTFVDDDICRSTLDPDSFDIVCSWEVLEHLHDTAQAFRAMHALLKPGGIMVHEYNPFFCLNGGHSLCTLDFLWGHTRLSEPDFSRYLDEFRPREKERALSFYKKGLNRMTLHALKVQLEEAGLEIISILPFTKEQHLRMIDEEILTQSKFHYPDVTLLDLSTPRVYVVAKKAKPAA